MKNFQARKEDRVDSYNWDSNKLGQYLKVVDSEIAFPTNSILFFDLTGESGLNDYYALNYPKYKAKCNNIGCHFIFLPSVKFPSEHESTFEYIIPHLKGHINFAGPALENLVNNLWIDDKYETEDYKQIVNYIGYTGNIQTGFILFFNEKISIVEYPTKEIADKADFFQKAIIESIGVADESNSFGSRRGAFSKRENYETSLEEKLDEETRKHIEEIKLKIESLKKSGQILYALPLLQKALRELENEIDITSLSEVKVDEEYNIVLPGFNNLIIPLSHLTKVVYVLFLNHPEGINIKELQRYKVELMQLYLSISPQENYEKIVNSIKDLTSSNSSAIYTHISRIKSTFYKIMDPQFANYYIVAGDKGYGSSLKYIPLIRTSLDFESPDQSPEDDIDLSDYA